MPSTVDTTHLLSRSIGVLGNDFKRILSWSLLLQAPRILLAILSDNGTVSWGEEAASVLALLVTLLPMIVLSQVQTAVLAPLVFDQLRSEGFEPRRGGLDWSLSWGKKVTAIGLAALAVALVAVAGFALFLIPGWLVLTGLFVTIPALLFEDLSPLQALKRSWQLTGPRGISIFALVFLFTLLEALLRMLLTLIGAPATVSALLAVPISALQAIAATVTYAGLVAPDFDSLQATRDPVEEATE